MQEIRNPLEALSYLNYLALDGVEDTELVRKYLQLAQDQIVTLSRIAGKSLGFVRLANVSRVIDLVDVAETALRIHQQTIEAKKIHLVKDFPTGLLAECHSERMVQAVSNLVVNALDALPEGGRLSVRFNKRQNHIHLLVVDNGHGIAPEHQDRVFERFFTTKGDAANGLGLSLSKRIVEDHKGKLSFRTTLRPGRSGTAFKICLPG